MIKLVDAEGDVHYIRTEDIVHVHLHEEEHKDDDNVLYWGYVKVGSGHYINLNAEGKTLMHQYLEDKEQHDKN